MALLQLLAIELSRLYFGSHFWKLTLSKYTSLVEVVTWICFSHSSLQPNSSLRKYIYIYYLRSYMFMTFIENAFFLAACWTQILFIKLLWCSVSVLLLLDFSLFPSSLWRDPALEKGTDEKKKHNLLVSNFGNLFPHHMPLAWTKVVK